MAEPIRVPASLEVVDAAIDNSLRGYYRYGGYEPTRPTPASVIYHLQNGYVGAVMARKLGEQLTEISFAEARTSRFVNMTSEDFELFVQDRNEWPPYPSLADEQTRRQKLRELVARDTAQHEEHLKTLHEIEEAITGALARDGLLTVDTAAPSADLAQPQRADTIELEPLTPAEIAKGNIVGHDQTTTNIAGGDVVGRDKITQVYRTGPTRNLQLPKLSLKLIKFGSMRTYHDEVVVEQPANPDAFREYTFGFALENLSESTSGKGIGIRIEVFWRGDPPVYSLSFAPPRRPEAWTAFVNQITNDQPAVMSFMSPQLICFYRQPIEWANFRLALQERLNGYIVFQYRVSSAHPQVDCTGELKVSFQ